MIKLTDREDCGWDVVYEYLSHELASDSDAEKHIVHSRKATAAKWKKANSGLGGRQYKSYCQRPPYSNFRYQRGPPPQGSMYNAHNGSPHSASHFASQSYNKWAHSTTQQNAIWFVFSLKEHFQNASLNRTSKRQ